MSGNINLNNSHVLQDGFFVNQKVQNVVMAIQEYEPEIEVQWIPGAARFNEHGDPLPAFKIVHNDPVNGPFTLFHVKDESEFDERVLMRIIQNDQRHSKQTLSDLEAYDQAQMRVKHQEYLDLLEQDNDVAWHILRSHKNTYKVSDDLIIKDGIPHNVANDHRPRHL